MTRFVPLSLPAGGGAADHADLPTAPTLRAGLSLARAGSMALSRRAAHPDHGRYLAGRGIAPGAACALHQVHSRRVVFLDEHTDVAALPGLEADGMLTLRPDLVLTVTVADCLPIILEDPATGGLALLHSGWRGTGIVLEALRLMDEKLGTRFSDVRATIGPGIGPCCYRVPEDRAALFASAYGADAVVRDGEPRLDLRRANVQLLERAGVGEVTVVTDCTSCAPALGSFRRQGAESYTLMLAWVGRARP